MPTYFVEGNAYVRPLYVDAPEELANKYAEIEEEVALRLKRYPKNPEGFVLILDRRGYGLMSAVPREVVDQVKTLPKGKGRAYGLIVAVEVAKSRVVTGQKEKEELIEEVEENPQARMTLKDKRLLEKYHKFLVVFGNTFQITGLPTSAERKPVKVEARPKPLPEIKQSEKAFEEIEKETEDQLVKDAVAELMKNRKTTVAVVTTEGKTATLSLPESVFLNTCGNPKDSEIESYLSKFVSGKINAKPSPESLKTLLKIAREYCKIVEQMESGTSPKPSQSMPLSPSKPAPTPTKPSSQSKPTPVPALRIKTPPPPPPVLRHPLITPYTSRYTPRVTPHEFTRAVHDHLRKLLGGNTP